MLIKDYELIENISMLFKNRNFIYGAGHDGKLFAEKLIQAGIEFEAFCDKKVKGEILKHNVIDVGMLKKMGRDSGDINIIVASRKCFDEILEDLRVNEIKRNIFSIWGVEKAIETNIYDNRFNEKYRENILVRRALWERNYYKSFRIRMFRDIEESDYRILVYQIGKVGSITLHKSISRYKKCLHVHHLNPNINTSDDLFDDYIYCNRLLKMNKLKIITMVREPITRFISDYFQESTFQMNKKITDDILDKLDEHSLENYPFKWFKEELEWFTGIDIFKYDFDRENGYTIINSPEFDILCLQTERMKFNGQVIGNFLGIEDFHLCQDMNVGDAKESGIVYKEVRENIRIPQSVIKRYYDGNNMEMNHFYSKEDQKKFLENLSLV